MTKVITELVTVLLSFEQVLIAALVSLQYSSSQIPITEFSRALL